MTDERPSGGVASIREAFRPTSLRGRLAIATAVIVLLTPSLAHFVSIWFLLLLPIALVVSLLGLGTGSRGQGRLSRAGLAMATNGALLMLGLFITGFLGDFVMESSSGVVSNTVGFGFTTVHIMLGLGLLLVDDYRHAARPDI